MQARGGIRCDRGVPRYNAGTAMQPALYLEIRGGTAVDLDILSYCIVSRILDAPPSSYTPDDQERFPVGRVARDVRKSAMVVFGTAPHQSSTHTRIRPQQ
jgi:hypothetical protein